MAISFKESLNYDNKKNVPIPMTKNTTVFTASVVNELNDNWTLNEQYEFYEDYKDTSISQIDSLKNIHINNEQINITQESNSQFIPFEMNRYYDGFDLNKTSILIHFVNENNDEDYDNPINVYYNDEKIKFGWLIDGRVTAVEGIVRFEIQAIGTNSQGEEYIWKTKPSSGINVLQSLQGSGIIKPDDSWINEFVSKITSQVLSSERVSDEANRLSKEAIDTANKAKQLANEAVNTANESKQISDETKEAVDQAQKTVEESKEAVMEAKEIVDTLPMTVSEDGYSEITNQRKILHVQSTKSDDNINVIVTLEGNKKVSMDIKYNENKYPISLTLNNHTATFGWSGF